MKKGECIMHGCLQPCIMHGCKQHVLCINNNQNMAKAFKTHEDDKSKFGINALEKRHVKYCYWETFAQDSSSVSACCSQVISGVAF
jgi:hypothetical protein